MADSANTVPPLGDDELVLGYHSLSKDFPHASAAFVNGRIQPKILHEAYFLECVHQLTQLEGCGQKIASIDPAMVPDAMAELQQRAVILQETLQKWGLAQYLASDDARNVKEFRYCENLCNQTSHLIRNMSHWVQHITDTACHTQPVQQALQASPVFSDSVAGRYAQERLEKQPVPPPNQYPVMLKLSFAEAQAAQKPLTVEEADQNTIRAVKGNINRHLKADNYDLPASLAKSNKVEKATFAAVQTALRSYAFPNRKLYYDARSAAPPPAVALPARWSVEQAKHAVIQSFNAFDPEWGRTAQEIFDAGNVQLNIPKEYYRHQAGRTHGSSQIPYVFANFNGQLNDVRVLAHEMAHAVQYRLMHQHGIDAPSVSNAQAETVAAIGEFLLFKALIQFPQRTLGQETSPEEKQYLSGYVRNLVAGMMLDRWRDNINESNIIHAVKGNASLEPVLETIKAQHGQQQIPIYRAHALNPYKYANYRPGKSYEYIVPQMTSAVLMTKFFREPGKYRDAIKDFVVRPDLHPMDGLIDEVCGANARTQPQFWRKVLQEIFYLEPLVPPKQPNPPANTVTRLNAGDGAETGAAR